MSKLQLSVIIDERIIFGKILFSRDDLTNLRYGFIETVERVGLFSGRPEYFVSSAVFGEFVSLNQSVWLEFSKHRCAVIPIVIKSGIFSLFHNEF